MSQQARDLTLTEQAARLGLPRSAGRSRQVLERFIELMTLNRGRAIRFRNRELPPPQNASRYSGEYEFSLTASAMLVRILSVDTLNFIQTELEETFNRMQALVTLAQNLSPNDRLRVIVTDGNFTASTPMRPLHTLTARQVFEQIAAVINSAQNFNLRKTKVTYQYVRSPAGGGTTYYRKAMNFDMFVKKKRCCIEIKAYRNDCFFQCLAIGLATPEDYRKLTKSKRKQVFREESALTLRDPERNPVGTPVALADLPFYERRHNITIHVIHFQGLVTWYKSSFVSDRLLVLLYNENDDGEGHFVFVNPQKVGALYNKCRYCFKCMAAFTQQFHSCQTLCWGCKLPNCGGAGLSSSRFPQKCERCCLKFFDQACFVHHAKTCGKLQSRQYCESCNIVYALSKKPHRCDVHGCSNCGAEDIPNDEDHECYHQTLDELAAPSEKYIFYDYEACLDEEGHHTVGGVVAMTFADDTPLLFEDHDRFIDWLFTDHEEYTAIAHNGGRYDLHFIKQKMIERNIKSNEVKVGNNIFYMYVPAFQLRFVDSRRFTQVSLRNFPATFGLAGESKDFFPYRFMTPERKHYKGPMPGLEWFDFHTQSPEECAEGIQWWSEHKDDQIDLYKMCMDYCINDVKILRLGCIKFREIFMSITNDEMDPLQYITIASVCKRIYQRFYMPEQTIGVLNKNPSYYHEKCWLSTLQLSHPQSRMIDTVRVSGVDEPSNTVYRFLSCVDAGCFNCFSKFTQHPATQRYMKVLHDNTVAEHRLLQRLGFRVVLMPFCEWQQILAYDRALETHLKSLNIVDPQLVMRDAFFGGRTEPIKMYRKIRPGEKIRYYDYTSLYPSVQSGYLRGLTTDTYNELRQLEYPIGHPIYFDAPDRPLTEYFGFIKCTLTPPEDLYLPLLPEKKHGKLMFDNTPKTGTWTTIEVNKAVELGYRIDHIYQIAHFERRSSDLFRDYVNTFLKIKQQAAGWTKLGCSTDEEKEAYCRDYLENQGIELDPELVSSNKGLYFIAKICLNSLWGKFGQRDSFKTTQDTFKEEDFQKLVMDDTLEILSVVFHNPRARTVVYQTRNEYLSKPFDTNIAIAAYTTAHARLRLYEALEILQDKVLYMDTDSVIFVDDGTAPLVLGPYLGDLTDELDDAGDYIEEFVSTGPKCYAYRTHFGHHELKVKGFTLNVQAREHISMEIMKTMVLDDRELTALTFPRQFDISSGHSIQTKLWGEGEGKEFRLTFDKRKISEISEDLCELNTQPIKRARLE